MQDAPDALVPLSRILARIEAELAAYTRETGGEAADRIGLALSDVTITLNVATKTEGGGGAAFGIKVFGYGATVGASAKVVDAESSKMVFGFEPPGDSFVMQTGSVERMQLARSLVSAHAALREAVDSGTGFVPKALRIMLKFGVTRSGGSEAEIDLVVLEGETAAKVSRDETHEIALSFSQDEP